MEPEVPEKLTINGQEYDPAEAQDFIEAGRKTREFEKQYNTTLDNVWPGYGKATQSVKQLESELQEARTQIQEFQNKKEQGTETQTDLAEAKEAARKLGIPLKEDLEKEGYIRKDDLEKFYTEREAQRDAVQKILSEADRLEKEIDGSDGRPKFNKRIVLAYAQAYNKPDLQVAYEEMHEDQVKAWKDAQIAQNKKPGLKTLTVNKGNKQPDEPKITNDNIDKALSEALWGAE